MNKTFLFLLLINSFALFSQDVLMQNGSFSQCSGVFYDSGGATSDYSNDESFIITICPDVPGELTQLDFTSFNTELNVDLMTIYNGPDNTFPPFGTFSGDITPFFVSATTANISGCITIEFVSNGSGTATGWEATISCFEPCQTIISQLDSATPTPNIDGYIRLCPNEEITLTGSGIFSVDGTGATYEWDLGDGNTIAGQTATFSYSNPGVYIVNLNTYDTNTDSDPAGCTNNNLINQVIQVSNEPDFTGTAATESIVCFGETTTIDGIVNAVQFINDCTPPVSGTTFLPDGSGVTYETSVTVDCYESSQTLTDINQLASICLTMEHSYLGDLSIDIISPTGQTVRMHDQGGGTANLGFPWATAPIDGNSANTTPGVGSQYCFVPGNSFPTLVNGVQSGGTFINGNGPGTYTDTFVPAGNYSSVNSLDGLLGSSLNGDWIIRVVDNFAQDNGFIFEWSIDFDPSILPPDLSFTPVITSEAWDTDVTIINTTGNTITIQPPTLGTYCYTYRVTNDFGCEYTEQVCIESIPEIVHDSPNNLSVCDTGAATYEFDLTVNTSVIVTPNPNPGDLVITYHETLPEAESGTNSISNAANYSGINGQIIYVRIEYQSSGCYETTSFSIEVFDTPTANTTIDFEQCDNLDDGDDTNGEVTFDLSTKINEILGTQLLADFEVKFYYTQVEADAGLAGTEITTPIQNTSNPQSIVTRIENRLNTNCYDTTTFNLIVFELPEVLPLVELFQCDDDTDGFTNFNLEEANELISTNYSNETFTYHTIITNAENGFNAIANTTTYLNINPTINPDILYVRTENADGCFRVSQLNLIVSTTQIPLNYQLSYEVCDNTLADGDDRNGIASFDFSDATAQIQALFPVQNPLITYYTNELDALAETNAITDISNHRNDLSPDVQTIFVRVDSELDNSCLGLGAHITLQVNALPIFNFEDEYLLCVNTNATEEVELPVIDTELSDIEYSFEWSLNNTVITGFTGSSYAPTQGGEYSVLVTNNITGCQDIDSTIVNESEPPTVTAELTSLAFAVNHVIEATAIGSGVYEYSLDGGPWQESGIFENVSPGEHIVTARDVNGCGISSAIVIVIDYPLYFTPNGDGYNDTWNIVGVENQPNAKIYIFDRYGKLLKQITPMSNGWNGTYNGNRLPTSDYWFTVEYDEPSDGIRKQFKAHFTLKR